MTVIGTAMRVKVCNGGSERTEQGQRMVSRVTMTTRSLQAGWETHGSCRRPNSKLRSLFLFHASSVLVCVREDGGREGEKREVGSRRDDGIGRTTRFCSNVAMCRRDGNSG